MMLSTEIMIVLEEKPWKVFSHKEMRAETNCNLFKYSIAIAWLWWTSKLNFKEI